MIYEAPYLGHAEDKDHAYGQIDHKRGVRSSVDGRGGLCRTVRFAEGPEGRSLTAVGAVPDSLIVLGEE